MKTLRQFGLTMGIMAWALLMLASPVLAEAPKAAKPTPPLFPLASTAVYGNVPAPAAGPAEKQLAELIYDLVMNLRYIIGAVAVLLIVIAGVRMVTGQGNDEVYGKARQTILWGVIGLAIVGLAGEMAKIFVVGCPAFTPPGETSVGCTAGGFLKDPNAMIRSVTIFNQRTQIVIVFIKYLIGSVAVFLIIRNALRLIAMGSEDDKIATDKKNLLYTVVGLILIVISDTLINKVFYKLDYTRYPTTGGAKPAIAYSKGIAEMVGFTNFAVSLVGSIAVLVLLAGGVLYITSAGDDGKIGTAKRMMTSALIGIIIIYGAFAIVSTVISGYFPQT